MIDVVLQLIIFFMYASQMAQMSRTLLDLPEEAGEGRRAVTTGVLVVDLDASGTIFVDREAVDLSRLRGLVLAELEKVGGDTSKVDLLVRADRRCPSGALNDLATHLKDLGVQTWRLGTLEPRGGASR